MRLDAYLARTHDTIFSLRGVAIEHFQISEYQDRRAATVKARLRYWDGSMLRLNEDLVEEGFRLRKVEYGYHYQQQDGSLIFRYDNVPHYPNLATFPHHKHVGVGISEHVEAAQPPQLTDVLREIERILQRRAE
jgi:hypothetical protein